MNRAVALRTGEALLAEGVITDFELEMALAAQKRLAAAGHRVRIGEIFVRMGMADWADVEAALVATNNTVSGVNSINLPPHLIHNLRIMPVEIRDRELRYAPVAPLSRQEEEQLLLAARETGLVVERLAVYPKARADVMQWISRITYVDTNLLLDEASALCADTHNAPLMQQFIDHVFQVALQERASDVHFARSADGIYCWISYRIDGFLRRRISMTRDAMNAVCTRLKSMAAMDTSESRRPQDGRANIQFNGRTVDLRLSSVPEFDGETIAVRMLDHQHVQKLEYIFRRQPEIGKWLKRLANIRSKTGGIVLVTGPTGQGKSATLASLLWSMPRTLLKVMTAEDPVESRIPFVHQSAINTAAGNSYATLLRSFMRQDPDVMMVGEIRDMETALEFLKGADTGHMMLATEHTSDVASAVSRLITLLPEHLRSTAVFTLSSSIRAILNQRLVPALCACATDDPTACTRHPGLFRLLGEDGRTFKIRRRNGCPNCEQTGYRGRELVVEAAFFPTSYEVRAHISKVLAEGRTEDIAMHSAIKHFSRVDAARVLLAGGFIDAVTAESILELALGQDHA